MKPRPIVLLLLFISPWCINALAGEVFQGVRYRQIEEQNPKRVSHVLEIDLLNPHIRFTTTGPNGDLPKETTSETTLNFVKRVGAQLGVNAMFFDGVGDAYTHLLGLAVADGVLVSPWDQGFSHAVNIGPDHRTVTFVQRPPDAQGGAGTVPAVPLFNTLTGSERLLEAGRVLPGPGGERHPRTAVGLRSDCMLVLLVIDGRQPAHSLGATMEETARVLRGLGALDGINLDGGGSSTMVIAQPEPRVVNVPLPAQAPGGQRIAPPGIQRANGNNLAVFAAPCMQDTDGDSLPDDMEGRQDADQDGAPDWRDADSDNDGIGDGAAAFLGLAPAPWRETMQPCPRKP